MLLCGEGGCTTPHGRPWRRTPPTSLLDSSLPDLCRIVTERESGKPRGFGFVEFYDAATAESAIRNLSGTELNGRTMRIVFAEGGPGDFRPRREGEGYSVTGVSQCAAFECA